MNMNKAFQAIDEKQASKILGVSVQTLRNWRHLRNRESNPYSRRIKAAVKAGPKSMTDLHSLFNRQLSKSNLDEAVQELIAQGAVELVKEKTKGRPKTLIKVVEQSRRSTVMPDKSCLNTDY